MNKEKFDSIMQHMYVLISCAKKKDEMSFHKCEYKWNLGFNVVSCFIENRYCSKIIENRYCSKIGEEKMMAFGVVVEVDFVRTDIIELWKNITNDV